MSSRDEQCVKSFSPLFWMAVTKLTTKSTMDASAKSPASKLRSSRMPICRGSRHPDFTQTRRHLSLLLAPDTHDGPHSPPLATLTHSPLFFFLDMTMARIPATTACTAHVGTGTQCSNQKACENFPWKPAAEMAGNRTPENPCNPTVLLYTHIRVKKMTFGLFSQDYI